MAAGFQIDKGIEIPPAGRGRDARYPFRDIVVGDSFLYSRERGRRAQNNASCHACWWGKRLGRKFATRKTPEGIRVWRVA